MRVEYETQEYIKGCIKTCESKKHLQQVAFSTFHNCLTQVCFTCNVCRTSLSELEQTKIKNNQSLKSYPQFEIKARIDNIDNQQLNNGNDGIPPKPKDLGILPTIT